MAATVHRPFRPRTRHALKQRAVARRRLGLLAALITCAAIAIATELRAQPSPPAVAGGPLVVTGPPTPETLATAASLSLFIPITEGAITGIAYHRIAGVRGVGLSPVGHQTNASVVDRMFSRIFGDGDGGAPYAIDNGSTDAVDIGATPGTAVYAPVTGQIRSIEPNVIDGDASCCGVVIRITPVQSPQSVLVVSALAPPTHLELGQQVIASQTQIGQVIDIASRIKPVLARYVPDSGNGVTLRLEPVQ